MLLVTSNHIITWNALNHIILYKLFLLLLYYATPWNPKSRTYLERTKNDFRMNRSTTSQILTIRRILEGVRAKNLEATILFVDFTNAFDSIPRGKAEQILLTYGLPKETAAAIMILYRNTKVKARSSNGDADYMHYMDAN